MSQESVKPHADAQAGGNPPEHERGKQRLPTEDKERGHCSNMQESHKNCGMPVNAGRSFFIHHFVAHFEFSNHRYSYWSNWGSYIGIQLEMQAVCAPAHLCKTGAICLVASISEK